MRHFGDLPSCDRGVLNLNALVEVTDAEATEVGDLTLGLAVLADNLGYFKLCHIPDDLTVEHLGHGNTAQPCNRISVTHLCESCNGSFDKVVGVG